MDKKIIIAFLMTLILVASSKQQENSGHLLIIGGGLRPDYMMEKVIELSGGVDSKILVIPNASSDPIDVANYQVNQLNELGAKNVDFIYVKKESANSDSVLALFDGVTGIFFSGGDQRRLTADLLGTKVLKRIKQIYKEGGLISGTSAGAAVMSEIMITGDEIINPDSNDSFTTIMSDNIAHTPGFGFVTEAIIDQHFIYRKRHNRLISLVLENPGLIGIGIDESTAILVYPSREIEVVGEYQVIIYDGTQTDFIRTCDEKLFSTGNIKMHILKNSERYDLIEKKIINN